MLSAMLEGYYTRAVFCCSWSNPSFPVQPHPFTSQIRPNLVLSHPNFVHHYSSKFVFTRLARMGRNSKKRSWCNGPIKVMELLQLAQEGRHDVLHEEKVYKLSSQVESYISFTMMKYLLLK